MERVVFIVNPRAGFRFNKGVEKIIREKSSKKNIHYTIEYTKGKGDGFYLAVKYINEGFDRIVAVGGDGTLREILDAVALKNVVVGLVPSGSGNGAARNLFLPFKIDEAVEVALGDKVVEVDCGVCNSKIFINVCGFGFDAQIARLFNENKIRGLLPYFIHGIRAYLNWRPFDVEVEFSGVKKVFRSLLVSVANGREYGGGAIINPSSSICDGKVELIVVDVASLSWILRKLPSLFNGKILENENVHYFTSTSFKIKIPPGSLYHLDGEDFISEDGILTVGVLPKAVRFALKYEIL